MKRRTIARERIVVMEEVLKPRASEIRRRIKIEKCIALGISLGIMAVSAAIVAAAIIGSYLILKNRMGGPGSEIFVLPAIACAFWWGTRFGENAERSRQEEEEIEIEEARNARRNEYRSDYRTAGARSSRA